ncbi:DUF7507 domain-containing protein [Nocardioides mangrovi]|uniref:DUF11 domain-containing protein n=1 Tax=Nocardioides mangrovi TaxID=2874580 RepID=A0ABS7UAK5_9ACTN|nr:DUF11 domain-containing protein [Nocardioides mangrovi]MBZ5738024.1 DUF11 domain-containing protein [Nocardioides mangrovi]
MFLLVAALAAVALALLPTAPARATGGGSGSSSSPSFACAADVVYSIDGDSHAISKINPTAGTFTANGTIDAGSHTLNALALPNGGGRYIYAFDRTSNDVVRFDASTNDEDTYSLSSNSSAGSVIAGAINPVNGLYYYAAGGSPWKLYAFNTSTNTGIGQVGTISGLSNNGDMAFDAVGNLYVVSNASTTAAGTLARVNGPLPSTAGSSSLAATSLATLPENSGQYASMAFDGNGYLIIGTGAGKVLKVNPTSGVLVQTKTVSLNLHDMASCSSPSTAAARVDLPQGRHDAADQFKVTITGSGVTTGNTGTTAGTDTGLQNTDAEVAGPVVVLPGTTYTITQTAAGGTDLNDYFTPTWKCVEQAGGTTVASGSGSTGTFTMPSTSGATVICTFTDLPILPAIELDKTASAIADLDGNGPDAGDTVTYGFKVTNTGNVALSTVGVTDPMLAGITCSPTTLAVGASVTCSSRTYTLTQADVNAGKVDNTATTSGKATNNVTVTDTDSVSVLIPAKPALTLDKTAGAITDVDGNGPDAGDTITYSFKVTNTGNVPLNPVTVADTKVGTVTCPSGALAPGATVTCTAAAYVLTQADVNAGKVDNTATASGTPPTGSPVTGTDSTTTVVPALPAIELDKTASAISNGTITYGFKVTNTGNVTFTAVGVTDPMFPSGISCSPTTLAPGASVTCGSKVYTLTQADTDAGKVQNTATTTGTSPSGAKVTDTDSTTTTLPGTPAIELDKTAGPLTNGKITYSFKVTNIGTVTLTAVGLTDPKLGGTITCAATTLAPGANTTCTSTTYTLTQADVDAGTVQNTATTTGTAPSGTKVTDTDSTTTPVPQGPAITLDKVAGPLTNGKITYTFTVKNTGNVTLDPVTLNDPKLGGTITCPSGAVAPGASISCTTTTYTLTQADVDAGHVDNTATTTGTAPSGTKLTDTDSTTTPVPAAPSIHLDKSAGPVTNGKITYTFAVTNTGNVTLNPIKVNDPKVGTVTCPNGGLAPGASVTCTAAAYVVTQADIDAGTVDNTATASGTPPTGSPVTNSDSTTTPIAPHPGIELLKSAGSVYDVNGNGLDDGDTITYTFKVTNTGNVTLTNVTVADPKVGPVTCPTAPLAPGASVSCDPRTYTLTQADIDHGSVDNTATATGTTPSGGTVADDDSRTVDLPATGAIQLVKTAGPLVDTDGNGPDAGDTITYSFRVTNTGNVHLDPVTVSDPKVGPVTCPTAGLEPGESFDCTDVTYTVTPTDVAAGKVDNTATATGTTPSGGTVQDTDSTTTSVQPTVTNVTIRKTVDDATPHVGDVVTYTLTVTNTGAADARDVVITDALPTGVTYVSADAPCTRTGSTVRCEIGTVPAGATRSFDVRVKVDPLPAIGADHQHLFDVQKTEVQVDVEAGDTATGTAQCMAGYEVTDGSGRIDHVDQGTGTLADMHMTANHAVGDTGWTSTFVNEATGRAQAKVFGVCVKIESENVNGHVHDLVVGSPISQTVALPVGRTATTLTCAAGQTPIQPGYQLDGVAPVLTTYPDDSNGWVFAVVNDGSDGATQATFTLRCLDNLVSVANGHTHALGFSEVRRSVTVPAGQTMEVTLSCAADAKGIVAGYDVDEGLAVLGNDPRPIVRVFQFYNPTNQPLGADLYLLCLANRTEKGADQGGHIVNTANVTTSTPESQAGDNSDSATIQVSPAVTPVAPLVTVSSSRVAATVSCSTGVGSCSGQATLTAQGTLLAKGSYRIKAGKKATLHLKTTRAGRKLLGKGLKKAKLTIDGTTRTVRIKR